MLSKRNGLAGRKKITRELRDLIFQMVADNPTWGAPRIHGELLKLGFDISERTVSRWMQRAPRDPEPAKRWETFLQNHREAIAAMDFFTVPTLTFGRPQFKPNARELFPDHAWADCTIATTSRRKFGLVRSALSSQIS